MGRFPSCLPGDSSSGSYLQAVIQGKVLVTFPCGEQQVARPLRVGGFVPRHLSVLRGCRLQVLSDPYELLPGVGQLGQEPWRQRQQEGIRMGFGVET